MMGTEFDLVVTVCDNAKETCPYFPGAKKYLHAPFKDPSGTNGNHEEILIAFEKIRDEIKDWIVENLEDK